MFVDKAIRANTFAGAFGNIANLRGNRRRER